MYWQEKDVNKIPKKQLKKSMQIPKEIQKRYIIIRSNLIFDRLNSWVIRNPILILDKETKLPISIVDASMLSSEVLQEMRDYIKVYKFKTDKDSIHTSVEMFNEVDKLMKLHEFDDVKLIFSFHN